MESVMNKQFLKILMGLLLFLTMTLFTAPTNAQAPSLNVPIITSSTSPTVTPTLTTTPSITVLPTPETNIIVSAAVGTQYPWNKRIPLKLTITPKISGQLLEVRWQSKASITGKPETATIVRPQAGKSYTFNVTLTPHGIGYQRAVADIILTTNSTNYVSSTNIPLQFNEKKVVIPVTSAYIFYQVTMYVALIVFFFIALPFLIYQLYLYMKNVLVPKWLESRFKKPL
jgi:hypothetical protein